MLKNYADKPILMLTKQNKTNQIIIKTFVFIIFVLKKIITVMISIYQTKQNKKQQTVEKQNQKPKPKPKPKQQKFELNRTVIDIFKAKQNKKLLKLQTS